MSGHENGDVALVDVEAAEALLVAREARSALRRSLALHGPVGGWDVWDRQPNDAFVPFPPFSSEREFADAVLERLDLHFYIEREVTGTHCSSSKPMRIDAVARPRAVSAWKDEAPAFGIEFKSPDMPRYGLDPAYTAQALDYTHIDWKGYGRLQVALCPSPLPIHRDEGISEYRILQSVLTHLGLMELAWLNGYGLALVVRGTHKIWTERTGVYAGRRWSVQPSLGSRH
ncbi:hypothetical protein [Streptomyces sp. NPDC002082]|uniref:hypothetical protein n=1 Tax=Streptomyces sp. NPDC002082 TaxID=3154772 RepID=UPI003320B5FD